MGRFTEAAACIDQALHRGMRRTRPRRCRRRSSSASCSFWNREVGSKSFGRRWNAWRPTDQTTPSIRALLARLDCELGHERQAQARLDVLARDGFGAVQRETSGCWRWRCWPTSRPWWENRNRSRRSMSCCVRIRHSSPARAHPYRIRVTVPRHPRCRPLPARRSSPIPSARCGIERPDRGPALERAREGRSCSGSVGSGCARRPRGSWRPSSGGTGYLPGARNDRCCRQGHRRGELELRRVMTMYLDRQSPFPSACRPSALNLGQPAHPKNRWTEQ